MSITAAGVALSAAFTGNATVILAAAETASPGFAPYLQGGGSAMAVGGLVYVARMIVRGELVPRPVRESEQELNAAILAAAQREAAVMAIAEKQSEDSRVCRERADKTLVALTEQNAALQAVAQEMAYWRQLRQSGNRTTDRGPR